MVTLAQIDSLLKLFMAGKTFVVCHLITQGMAAGTFGYAFKMGMHRSKGARGDLCRGMETA